MAGENNEYMARATAYGEFDRFPEPVDSIEHLDFIPSPLAHIPFEEHAPYKPPKGTITHVPSEYLHNHQVPMSHVAVLGLMCIAGAGYLRNRLSRRV